LSKTNKISHKGL